MRIIAYVTMPIIFLLLGSSQVFAVEKITGAFGMELGEKFAPSTTTHKIKSRAYSYVFKPENGFRSFSSYILLITPKTNLIYKISAWGKMENLATCKSELNVVMSILERKYGKAIGRDIGADTIGAKRISQDNMYVWAACSRGNAVIRIGYGDGDLSAQAKKERLEVETEKKKLELETEKERIELETKKVDSSGL